MLSLLKRILEILLRLEKQMQEQKMYQQAGQKFPGVATPPTVKPTPTTSNDQAAFAQAREARIIYDGARKLETQLSQREEGLERKLGILEERERMFLQKGQEINSQMEELERIKKEQLEKLTRLAGLTQEEARKIIMDAVKNQMMEEVAKEIKEAENRAKEEADKKARDILTEAMLKAATDYVAEYTVSVVKIPDEEIKGRIIGKEGRNIRTFEKATGVDVELDETPNEIRLSSFDAVRREIARVALEKLIADGRIQPQRIEEIVEHTKKDIEKVMFSEGEKLAHAVGVYNLPVELIAFLGKFKYRFSYGQNMISHTLEETKIGVALALSVGADVNIVRLGCLLHDIGKVITDKEGTHVQLGIELLKKYNIPQAVIDGVASHHEDVPFASVEAVLVYIADAISGSRPGARYEDYDEYIKRLTDLENIAKAKEGVEEAYTFQAGRELRVIVKPEKVSDSAMVILSHDIAKEIKEKVKNYPGQIKVTVIRENRSIEAVN